MLKVSLRERYTIKGPFIAINKEQDNILLLKEEINAKLIKQKKQKKMIKKQSFLRRR